MREKDEFSFLFIMFACLLPLLLWLFPDFMQNLHKFFMCCMLILRCIHFYTEILIRFNTFSWIIIMYLFIYLFNFLVFSFLFSKIYQKNFIFPFFEFSRNIFHTLLIRGFKFLTFTFFEHFYVLFDWIKHLCVQFLLTFFKQHQLCILILIFFVGQTGADRRPFFSVV